LILNRTIGKYTVFWALRNYADTFNL
jgi:hypothetical protein